MKDNQVLIGGIPEKTMNYQRALAAAGCQFQVGLQADSAQDFGGLLLPGGADPDPSLFGQPLDGARNIDLALDRSQLLLLGQFIRLQKPVFGICRGMQIINIYFGGSLIQHLDNASCHLHPEHDLTHATAAHPDSFLSRLYGTRFTTNSAHHQAVGTLGRGLAVIQQSEDGVAEGMVHRTLPIIAVQWHPERMCLAHRREDTVDGMALIRYFIGMLRH